MKKRIITVIAIIACAALCAAVWLRSAEGGDLPAEPVKTAVIAEIEARSEEKAEFFISADAPAPEAEAVAESEPVETEISAEKETQKPAPTQTAQSVKPNTSSTGPHMRDVRIVNGEKQIYILGFGWIKDEGGGSVGTMVGNPGDELTGNKVSIMGGCTTVDDKGDINKQVGIMGGGSVAEDMYENGHKIGIMGGEECPSGELTSPPSEQPEPTGDVIYIELQPVPTKDSPLPPYKPNGEPTNP
ncbi:hypothetical protein [Marasmitruncus massiliensis]|jgi:hypothetical protein|uniref:hypothetical protein n=1 Tax=Marasmitruncus massiliensis TaxID=1944642 RepID=UPI000C7C125B|nr:hypothetical protein [Marasmitruncus massiliensis]